MPFAPVHIHVPATSANLGPGFDALGMALDLGLDVRVNAASTDSFEGQGEAAEISMPNLVFTAAAALCAELGLSRPPMAVVCHSDIPLARGLGSSAAAICSGLLAARALTGTAIGMARLLDLAARLEGHPDNVTPALLGGITVAVRTGTGILACPIPLASDLAARLALVLAIPHTRLETRRARAVLPDQVPHHDAVFNAGRTALLVAALGSGRLDALEAALDDRLHEPYRRPLIPRMADIAAAAKAAGAVGVTLSGAGPALLAWSPLDRAGAVGRAMKEAWGAGTEVRPVPLSARGATVAVGTGTAEEVNFKAGS